LLDYVALTAAEASGVGIQPQNALATLFAGTRLELGRYLDPEGRIYIAWTQPLTGESTTPGVRLEWRFMPTLTAEFFSEDRFARSYNFANTSERHRNWGFFLFREWGY